MMECTAISAMPAPSGSAFRRAGSGSAFVVFSDSQQSFLLTSFTTIKAATIEPAPAVTLRKQGQDDITAKLITWDEGSTNEGGGGHVALVAVSPLARPGERANDAANHYSLLRTVEDAWGLGCLAESCSAKNLAGLFAPR